MCHPRNLIGLCLSFVLLSVMATHVSAQTIIYVDAGRPVGGDGQSWGGAFTYLQDALAAAEAIPEPRDVQIWVAKGTYWPDRDEANPLGTGDREAVFDIRSGIGIYGGFKGDEASLAARPIPLEHETILSGDLNDDDTVTWYPDNPFLEEGVPEIASVTPNSYRVVYIHAHDVIVDGFTITGGYAVYTEGGGGMLIWYDGPVTVVRCTFAFNRCTRWEWGQQPVGGGGLSAVADWPGTCEPVYIRDCQFIGNSATGIGGGLAIRDRIAEVENCVFRNNYIHDFGGVLGIGACVMAPEGQGSATEVTFRNCDFHWNRDSDDYDVQHGGGLGVTIGTAYVYNCTFSQNDDASVQNSPYQPGNVFVDWSYVSAQGGGVVWGDNNIYGASSAVGYVDANGLDDVVGTDDDNLRLAWDSACVDAGDNDEVPADLLTDLDGNPRILNGDGIDGADVDMGAYEFNPDCDGNGVYDSDDLADCDGSPWCGDCNENGVLDVCDIASGTSADLNGDGIPDECMLDCNGNLIPDDIDIFDGTSTDYDGNFIPDECQLLVYNENTGSVYGAISAALRDALDGDVLIASPLCFDAEPDIEFGGRDVTLKSMRDIVQAAGGLYELTDGARIQTPPSNAIDVLGEFRADADASVDVRSGTLTIEPTGEIICRPGSTLGLAGTTYNDGSMIMLECSVFADAMVITGTTHLSAAIVFADGIGIDIEGRLNTKGEVYADITNDGEVYCLGDTLVVGDYLNNGITIVQIGTLTIVGDLINNGEIIGDVSAPPLPGEVRRLGDGMAISGNYSAGASASLLMPDPVWTFAVGGDFDVAINDNRRYDMSVATLRMAGLAGSQQTVELMGADVGADASGMDPMQPGSFPIGTLRLGGTTVDLVDNHDNDGLGQDSSEAVYIAHLIVEAGTRLNTNGKRVYYGELTLNGAVDDADNLVFVAIPCPEDIDGIYGVGQGDLGMVLGRWGDPDCLPGGAGYPCVEDLDGVDGVGQGDLGMILSRWGDPDCLPGR
jgi:hypothetical protein